MTYRFPRDTDAMVSKLHSPAIHSEIFQDKNNILDTDSVSSYVVPTTSVEDDNTLSPSNSPLGAKILFPAPDVAKEDKSFLTARVETLENEVSDLKHTVHHMNQKLDYVMDQLERVLSALPPSRIVPDLDTTISSNVPSETPVFEQHNVIQKTPEPKPFVRNAWHGTNSQIKVGPSISTPVPPKAPNATPSLKVSEPQPRPTSKVINTNTSVTLTTRTRRATSPVLNPSRAAEGEPKTSNLQDRLSRRSSIGTRH